MYAERTTPASFPENVEGEKSPNSDFRETLQELQRSAHCFVFSCLINLALIVFRTLHKQRMGGRISCDNFLSKMDDIDPHRLHRVWILLHIIFQRVLQQIFISEQRQDLYKMLK